MKIKFDATQPYQRAAVDSVVDLFEGQPLAQSTYESSYVEEGVLWTETGVGNNLVISDEQLLLNLQTVQAREENFVPEPARDTKLVSRDFTVEMETGTGKTYVYLRTIHELRRKYGWRKFIIVVPSVAIREGVLQSLNGMREHFADLFQRQPIDAWVYDSKDINKVRSFNRDNDLKVMVMTLASFNKAGNVLFKDIEGLGQGIDLISQTRPIVIMDEPQKMESKKSRDAIGQLNPLLTLRYSATHKDRHHQVYKLDPVRAYDLGLVKQIMVRSVLQERDLNSVNVHVKEIKATKTKVIATIEIDVAGKNGVVAPKSFKIDRERVDLEELSGGLSQYRGWIVEDIRADEDVVVFANNREVAAGQQLGIDRDQLMQAQVRAMVEKHLEHELTVRKHLPRPGERMKVLSVVFIDKVANYAGPIEAQPKIRRWFEQSYAELGAKARYAVLALPDADEVHAGYFAKDRAGSAKDTSGVTIDDQTIYDEIMRDKTKLLDLDNPRRFIFSHSALREGWDNPNVFQICTLNESKSADRKRQEIGRGLRLPVNESGERCFDPRINKVTVIANEHYDDFARSLQAEIEEETGVQFGAGRIKDDRDQIQVSLRTKLRDNPEFLRLWKTIRARTRYRVTLDTDRLVEAVVEKLALEPAIHAPKYSIADAGLGMKRGTAEVAGGVEAKLAGLVKDAGEVRSNPRIPDVVGYLQRETGLTRATVVRIVKASGRIGQLNANPQAVLDLLARVINAAKSTLMVDGISYQRLEESEDVDFEWELDIIDDGQGLVDRKYLLEVQNSVYTHVRFDSAVEREFTEGLEDMYQDVLTYLKLPARFKVRTPLGNYNPDWAILLKDVAEGREREVALVAETKSTRDREKLRPEETAKIACGREHFKELGVPFLGPITAVEELVVT